MSLSNLSRAKRPFISVTFIVAMLFSCVFLAILTSDTLPWSTSNTTTPEPPRYIFNRNMDMTKLPELISADGRALGITSPDALPTAFEFARLNWHLRIQKIVLLKQSANDTDKEYPFHREGLRYAELKTGDIIALMLLFLMPVCMLCIVCHDVRNLNCKRPMHMQDLIEDDCENNSSDNDDSNGKGSIDKEELIKAEKKRKEIETV